MRGPRAWVSGTWTRRTITNADMGVLWCWSGSKGFGYYVRQSGGSAATESGGNNRRTGSRVAGRQPSAMSGYLTLRGLNPVPSPFEKGQSAALRTSREQ